jgi:hypothetical protein
MAQASIILGFPSPTSTRACGGITQSLGAGGGGICFNAADNIVQTSTGSPEWQFSMSDFTAAGVHNTFALLINSVQGWHFFI